MISIVYCPICKEKLQNFGEMPNALYETICELYIKEKKASVFYEDDHQCSSYLFQILNFLEHHRFVVTTEIGYEDIAALPNGIVWSKIDDTYICFQPDQHK